MGDHHESPYGEGAETTQRTRLLYRRGRTDSQRTVDFLGCRPDHPALQQRQSWPSKEGARTTWMLCEPWFVSELALSWENPVVSAAKHKNRSRCIISDIFGN